MSSGQILCRTRRGSDSSLASSVSTFFKRNNNSGSNSGLPSINSIDEELLVVKSMSISQQILPLIEIKPCFSYRMRSVSDSELKNANSESGKQLQTDNNNNNLKTSTLVVPGPIKRLKKPSKKVATSRWDSIISCEIPFNQIKVDDDSNIGQGSFGTVKKAQDFYHGLVAIKFLNVQSPTECQINAFRNEMAILKSTRHDNILLFIGCLLKPNLAIVTEFCPGSSLYRHFHVNEEVWEMSQIVDIAKQTSTGMEYLHARQILHRDLKSNNLFLIPNEAAIGTTYSQKINHHHDSSQWKVKIGDFGLATFGLSQSTSSKMSNPSGSVLWMAPEVITQRIDDPYSNKSDVYSFAVVLYELVTGHLPFQKKEQNMIFFLVGAGRLKLVADDARQDTPIELMDLITTCSKYNRDDRLDFVQINEVMARIKVVKQRRPILKRSQSLPNIYLNSYNSYLSSNFVLKNNQEFTEIDLLNDSTF